MASRTPGTFSFDKIGDLIHRARLFADNHTPGFGTMATAVAPFIGGPAGFALQGAAQPDVMKPNPMSAFAQSPQAPISTSVSPPILGPQTVSPPPTPFPQGTDPMTAGGPPPAMRPSPAPQAAAPVPMPMARPAEAPQAPSPMGFFARNAAMMTDPMTGQFIDPNAASDAQVRGPDLINKMMAYLHKKADA
jgi:hypothetical protein